MLSSQHAQRLFSVCPASETGKSKLSLSVSDRDKCWQHHGVFSVHSCQMKPDLIPILPSAHKKLQKTINETPQLAITESQNPTGVGEREGMQRKRRGMQVKNRQMRSNSPQESSILTETTPKNHLGTSQVSPGEFPKDTEAQHRPPTLH